MLELKTLQQHALRTLVVAGLAVSACLVSVPNARAEIAIAGDLEAILPLDVADVSTGPSFGVRLGWQLHLPLIALTPEIGYKWGTFPRGATINRGIIGGRVSIGEVFRFGVSAHVGFGHRTEEYQTVEHSNTGMSLDGGLFLDLTILPLLDIGVHIDYGRIAGDAAEGLEVLQWMTFGAHVALII
jgi:hypothetical protein